MKSKEAHHFVAVPFYASRQRQASASGPYLHPCVVYHSQTLPLFECVIALTCHVSRDALCYYDGALRSATQPSSLVKANSLEHIDY